MRVNVYTTGESSILRIRFMGCNRLPHTVSIAPTLRTSYIIHYVTKGQGTFNGTPLKAGMGFLIYPGQVAAYQSNPEDPWELLWIVSEDENMEKLFPLFHADSKTQIFSYSYLPPAQHMMDTLSMLPAKVIGSAAMLELFFNLFKHQEQTDLMEHSRTRSQSYAKFAVEYIQSNYYSPLTIQELQELLGVSQPYLFRIFKEATGKAPKQYLNDYRLLQAKKLLTTTSLSITEVANSVGYADVLTFSRFFSSKEGCSPRAYRNRFISKSH